MKLLLATHESSMRHDTGYAHPERPARIAAVVDGIMTSGVEIVHLSPEPATTGLLESVHDPVYIKELERFCAAGGGPIDMDTYAGPDSWEAALRAAAAGPAVCTSLASGTADLGFVAMRPPGHHATHDQAMGFCLFNNVAVTAAHLTATGSRVAIVDWDVHHGNGTQDMFFADPNVLYLSVHQAGIYPGTGSLSEVGTGRAEGTNLNIAVPSRTGGQFYRRAMEELLVPVIRQFEPDWLLISAGYDAHEADPLAGLELVASDYGAMAKMLSSSIPAGRCVLFLEGGYDEAALKDSAAQTVKAWLDPAFVVDSVTAGINPQGYMLWAHEVASRFWQLA